MRQSSGPVRIWQDYYASAVVRLWWRFSAPSTDEVTLYSRVIDMIPNRTDATYQRNTDYTLGFW